jgi:hypothetical protein
MVEHTETEPCDWERTVGLSNDTTYVAIYPAREHADTWMDEANERGQSRSRYLIELIQEARSNRDARSNAENNEQHAIRDSQV